MALSLEEAAAYHEPGHAVMHLVWGIPLQYVSILRGPGLQVGGTKGLEDPGPYAPEDGSVNMKMLMVTVAGPIAEELATGVAYGSDRQEKSDHDRVIEWASRGCELSDSATKANLYRGWAEAERLLLKRWSEVVALAEALLSRKVLTAAEIVHLLLDLEQVPYPGRAT